MSPPAQPKAEEAAEGRGFALLGRALEGTVVLAFVALVVVAFAQVVFRYALGNSLSWAEEVSRYLFVWIVFLASAITLDKGRHIAVDSLQESLSERARTVLQIVLGVFIAVFLVVVIWKSHNLARIAMIERAPASGVPLGLVQMAMPIGAALMLLYTARDILRLARGLRRS
jgi:TRAP-type C4-dicarboxylate transport system permease small subunit